MTLTREQVDTIAAGYRRALELAADVGATAMPELPRADLLHLAHTKILGELRLALGRAGIEPDEGVNEILAAAQRQIALGESDPAGNA